MSAPDDREPTPWDVLTGILFIVGIVAAAFLIDLILKRSIW